MATTARETMTLNEIVRTALRVTAATSGCSTHRDLLKVAAWPLQFLPRRRSPRRGRLRQTSPRPWMSDRLLAALATPAHAARRRLRTYLGPGAREAGRPAG